MKGFHKARTTMFEAWEQLCRCQRISSNSAFGGWGGGTNPGMPLPRNISVYPSRDGGASSSDPLGYE